MLFEEKKKGHQKYTFCNSNIKGTHLKFVRYVGNNKTVLDIGCGPGVLAEKFMENGCKVVGIEIDKKSALFAREKGVEVIIADAESLETIPYPYNFFDVIVFAGVLQFFKRPDLVLLKFKKFLKEDGYIVASISNICEWRMRMKILLGKFDYKEVGLLDKGHLRFFTFSTAKRLFKETGYNILNIDYNGLAHLKIFRICPSLFASEFVITASKTKN